MAATNERFPMPDQVWFDPANPEPLHDALRTDYAKARAAVERRPSLRRHLENCDVCQAITAATAGAPAPTAGRKRIKLVLGPEQMHRLLSLPANFEIVHMFATHDPNIVSILVAGEGLPDVDPLSETPAVTPDAMTQRTRNRAS
jgi:hypothetical protein